MLSLLLIKLSAYGIAAYSGARLYKQRTQILSQTPIDEHQEKNEISDNTANKVDEKILVSSEHQEIHPADKPLELSRAQLFALNKFQAKLGFVALISYTAAFFLASPFLIAYSIGMMLWGGSSLWKRSVIKLKEEKRASSELVLVSLSFMCIATGQIAASSIAIIFASFADRLQLKTEDHTRKKLLHLFNLQLDTVWIVTEEGESQIPIEQLNLKDIIIVHTGEMIPIDGVITNGFITADQHVLTGESQPVEKGIGEHIYASTLVITGKAYASVEKTGRETAVSQIAHILDNTIHYTKKNIQSESIQFSDRQALPVLSSTVALGLLNGVYSATSFIISWSPGRVRILSSISMLNYLRLASEESILIKDGRALEQFHHVDVVIFDKTGTLTNEQPGIGEILVCNGYTTTDVLRYMAAAESKLTHPIARAILQYAEQNNIVLPEKDDMAEYELGYGIRMGIEGKIIRVGSKRFMEQESISIPENIQQAYEQLHQSGSSIVFAAIDNHLIGAIEMCTTIRPEVTSIIRSLRKEGVKIAIVSGDHEEPTRRLAKNLEIDDYLAEALPQDKVNYIKRLQEESKVVCFVGDGINDSLALKQAQVGISMSGASNIATETAQIVFMKNDLSGILNLSQLSKSLNENVDRNMLIASWIPGVIGTGATLIFHLTALPIIILGTSCLGLGVGNAMSPLLIHKIEKKDSEQKAITKK
ncbi:MAG: heavy metal translocating P-type ATPase [Candidatus Parabeggiatoa sp.]|nr:heavy metal translocating P-type ATPase [Candidatus Parabeggiatoa sp.]